MILFCLIASITPCAAKFWPVDNVPFHCNKFEFFSLFLSAIPRTSTAHSLTLPIVIHFRQYVHTLLHLLHKNDANSRRSTFPQRWHIYLEFFFFYTLYTYDLSLLFSNRLISSVNLKKVLLIATVSPLPSTITSKHYYKPFSSSRKNSKKPITYL